METQTYLIYFCHPPSQLLDGQSDFFDYLKEVVVVQDPPFACDFDETKANLQKQSNKDSSSSNKPSI